MATERTYKFIEQFLKWNFDELPPETKGMLHGSPCFATNMWSGLLKIGVKSHISMVLFDSVKYLDHKVLITTFMEKTHNNLSTIPVHFVTSIEDHGFDVHFDLKGDITKLSQRIRLVEQINKNRVDALVISKAAPKILQGPKSTQLRTAFSNISKLYHGWRYRGKNEHWDAYEPYWKLIEKQNV